MAGPPPLYKIDLEPRDQRLLREPVPAQRGRRPSTEVRVSVIHRDLRQAVEVPVDAANPLMRVPWRCGRGRETAVVNALIRAEVPYADRQFDRSPPVVAG